jgi:hypothetical protein
LIGTISPRALRTYTLSRSSGRERYSGSACRILEQPAVLRELAHVQRSEHGLQRRVDLLDRHALGLGARVQIHQQLPRARIDRAGHAAQFGPLMGLGDKRPNALLQLR